MSLSPARQSALRAFAESALAAGPVTFAPASADASFRSYWRVRSGSGTRYVVMDAPPGREDLSSWLDIGRRLHEAGLHTPEVHATDLAAGFVLMEDLGNRTYLPLLDDASVDGLYDAAFAALLRMQSAVDPSGLPAYSRDKLIEEMELMPTWFLGRHLGCTPTCEAWDVLEDAYTRLVHNALEQPAVFVHRDWHSRNLLVTDVNSPGIIDFQDACVGPVTYDLVSLLRDGYIAWPADRVSGWVDAFHARLAASRQPGGDADRATFRRWFDLMGLQRHIKVLGIFCRLWYRDGKPGYLADLPRVWRYVTGIARAYPEFAGFADLLESTLGEDAERILATPRAERTELAASASRAP